MYPTTWWPWSEYACQYMPMPSHAPPACDATARSLGTMVLAGPNHHRRQCREGRAPESGNVTWNVTWISTPSLHWFCGYLNHFEASYWHSVAQLGCNLFGTIRDPIVRVSPCCTTAGIFWCGCVLEAGRLHQHESLDWRSQGRHWVIHRRLKVWTI